MNPKSDYTLSLNNGVDIKDIKNFLDAPSAVEIPDKPLGKKEIGTLLTKSLLYDLYSKDYDLQITKKGDIDLIDVWYPVFSDNKGKDRKNSIREGHIIERDSQLQQRSNKDFIKKMEAKRLHGTKWVSIYDLMADGNNLVEKIKKFISSNKNTNGEKINYDTMIDPYIEFVNPDKDCKHTGMKLNDIWRYFRHTWSLEYKSLPGRSIRILIRDRSFKNHPIIGIAGLGSSVAQQTVRDEMLGWSQSGLSGQIEVNSKWYEKTKKRLLNSIKYSDLINKTFSVSSRDDSNQDKNIRIKGKEIDYPSDETIKNLNELSLFFMDLHHAGDKGKKRVSDKKLRFNKTWEEQSKLPLFKSKRCRALKIVLEIDLKTQKENGKKNTYQMPAGEYKKLLRQVKAEKVGIDLMDIIICGAIPPYNELLCGKLVAMLLTSPEVIQYVKYKYEKAPSIIASSIKGKAFYRIPNLVFLGTTSLYGKGLSQYTRISIPSRIFGDLKNKDNVKYKSLGETLGFGNYHISRKTIELARLYSERTNPDEDSRAPRVKYIFGEGINPLFRMITGAFIKLGYPSHNILQHKNPRAVYGVNLIENTSQYLLGKHKHPKYLVPQTHPKKRTRQIFYYWAKRWMSKRIRRNDVLEKISAHTLDYPIKHGARVELPNREEYGPLFDD